jgi:hypothetical protein
VRVIDVFAMPQSGTGVSVEAVDPVFQTKMLDMLKQTGRFVRENWSLLRAPYVHLGPKWLLAGITAILASAAGSLELMLILNRFILL